MLTDDITKDAGWVHPDSVVGPGNVLLVELFRDVDWRSRAAVAERVRELEQLDVAL